MVNNVVNVSAYQGQPPANSAGGRTYIPGGPLYLKKDVLALLDIGEKHTILWTRKCKDDVGRLAYEIREVQEEFVVSGIRIINALQDTYHTYEINGIKILKRTYWFSMHTDSKCSLEPQIEEGITEVVWVDKEQIAEKLNNSFRTIKELLE